MVEKTIEIDGEKIIFLVPEEVTHDQLVNTVIEGVSFVGGRPKNPRD